MVTAVAPAPAFGTQVVITATSGSLSNSITIKEANYTIYPYPIQLAVGDSAIVHVSGCAYGSGVRPSFASSSPTVATVTGFSSGAAPDSATIKAIGVGQTTIHATCYVGLTGDRFPSVSVYLYVTVVSASAQAAQEPTPTVVAAIPLLSFLHESRDSDRRLLMH